MRNDCVGFGCSTKPCEPLGACRAPQTACNSCPVGMVPVSAKKATVLIDSAIAQYAFGPVFCDLKLLSPCRALYPGGRLFSKTPVVRSLTDGTHARPTFFRDRTQTFLGLSQASQTAKQNKKGYPARRLLANSIQLLRLGNCCGGLFSIILPRGHYFCLCGPARVAQQLYGIRK